MEALHRPQICRVVTRNQWALDLGEMPYAAMKVRAIFVLHARCIAFDQSLRASVRAEIRERLRKGLEDVKSGIQAGAAKVHDLMKQRCLC